MSFSKLNEKDKVFEYLEENNPVWWERLRMDPEINIEVRKDNYIDVYYNGGAIIKRLQYDKNKNRISGAIHFEYIPLIRINDDNDCYIPYNLNNIDITIAEDKIKPISINNFDKKSIKAIKKRITKYNNSSSEKYIQSNFVKNDHYYIDFEFAYKHMCKRKSKNKDGEFVQQSTIRIDLVRVDVKSKQIVFVEVKRMLDARLDSNEARDQLRDYKDFIKANKENLLNYYKKVFNIKKKLGILPIELDKLDSLEGFSICNKPLLLFGDCTQKWIDENSCKLDSKIRDIALGCYYFGNPKPKANLILKTTKNKHIY